MTDSGSGFLSLTDDKSHELFIAIIKIQLIPLPKLGFGYAFSLLKNKIRTFVTRISKEFSSHISLISSHSDFHSFGLNVIKTSESNLQNTRGKIAPFTSYS